MKSLYTGGAIFVLLLITLLSTCTKVGPKEAGFRVNNAGDYRGVNNIPLCTGYQFYIPWVQHIEKVSTTMEHIVWSNDKNEGEPTDQAITISCLGGAGFNVNIGLNIHVIATEAPRMWIKWKEVDVPDIMSKFLRNVIRGDMQRISGTMTVDSVLNNYAGLEDACRKIVSDSLRAYGFYVDGFNFLGRPTASDKGLEEAIHRTIIAKRDADTRVMEQQSTTAEANKKIIAARGDSASAVIEAAGQAEAIRLKQREITPTYVEYIKWLNASNNNPRVPSTVLGSGTGYIYSPK